MSFVIDLQGFNNNDNVFVPKKIAIASVDEKCTIGHWIVQPTQSYRSLSYKTKRQNKFISQNIHGLSYFDGITKLGGVVYEIRKITRNADTVYVRGHCKAEYLKTILRVEVVDLERDILNPSFAKMPDVREVCYIHSVRRRSSGTYTCALNNTLKIRQWILEGAKKMAAPEDIDEVDNFYNITESDDE